MADVIANRLSAQMQLFGDLPCRTAALEEPKHLRLFRREVQLRVCVRFLDQV
jgi:hypothetical protein